MPPQFQNQTSTSNTVPQILPAAKRSTIFLPIFAFLFFVVAISWQLFNEKKHVGVIDKFYIYEGNYVIEGRNLSKVEIWQIPTGTDITEDNFALVSGAQWISGDEESGKKFVSFIKDCPLATNIFARGFNLKNKKLEQDVYLSYNGASEIFDNVCKKISKIRTDWKTYINKKYGFELKYPAFFERDISYNSETFLLRLTTLNPSDSFEVAVSEFPSYDDKYILNHPDGGITCEFSLASKSWERYLYDEEKNTWELADFSVLDCPHKIQINDNTFYLSEDKSAYIFLRDDSMLNIYLNQDNNSCGYTDNCIAQPPLTNKKTLESILSTFKFISTSTPVDNL